MLTNNELYLIHGWGFDNQIWNNWLPHIDKNISTYIFDRGYFKNKKQDFSFNISSRSKIVITHSFGLHYLTKQHFNQIHLLVLISGFRHFHAHAQNEQLSKKQIVLMKHKLVVDPTEVLKNFYSRCGIDNRIVPMLINCELLYEDLLALDMHQTDLDDLKSVPRILLLQGNQDHIVPAEHSIQLNKHLSNSKLFLNDTAEHALPFTDHIWCINTIQALLNNKIFVQPDS
jgi:pimeloyl-ACP methyl ester carboxylesterase